MRASTAFLKLAILSALLFALPASSDPWDRAPGGSIFPCYSISTGRPQCTFDFTDSSEPDRNLGISSDCRPFIWLDPDISGTADDARIDVARCATSTQTYANCTEVDTASKETRYAALGRYVGINIDTPPSGVTARVYAQCEPLSQAITENSVAIGMSQNFGADLHNTNQDLNCWGPVGSGLTSVAACTGALWKSAAYVYANETVTIYRIAATVTGPLDANNTENCNVILKIHPTAASTQVCDAGGAGPHLCDDTNVVLEPLFDTGDFTCGGNCDPVGSTTEQEVVNLTPPISVNGSWTIAIGPRKYCSYGAAEADGGDLCIADGDCEGTCETLLQATGVCGGIESLNVQVYYDSVASGL
jgi:hypothetical protein